jgi:3-hydroxybutyryl-CoA dehydrogenase
MIAGIIGSGAMGAGIAQVIATAGNKVLLLDVNHDMLEKASGNIRSSLDKLIAKGSLSLEKTDEVFANITFTQDYSAFRDCNIVIEAIVEDLQAKQQLFRELNLFAADACILASNTSSLSITSIASVCNHPERFIGIHFFNPATVMQLVEIIPAIQTKPGLADEVKAMVLSWGKFPVIAKDTPGFIVNRVARPFYGEAIRIMEEGIADCATIDWAMTTVGHFKMGPFALMDFIGHDVNYRVTESVFKAFFYDPRYKPSFTQKRLFEAGYYGKKSGKGFYNYEKGSLLPEPVKDEQLGKEIVERIVAMLINEAADVIAMNVASKEDLEIAMTKGVNYPKGLLAWADEWGVKKAIDILDSLYEEYHEDRYRVSVLLRKMMRENKKFFVQDKKMSIVR